MNKTDNDRLKVCLEAYGADASRWPQSAHELRALLGTANHGEVREAEEIDRVLSAASVPADETGSMTRILHTIRREKGEQGGVVLLRPRAKRLTSRSGWMLAAPLAASFALGIIAGLAGSVDTFLPVSSFAGSDIAQEGQADFSGISDAEAELSEGTT